MKSEQEIRNRKESLIQNKHDYFGVTVDGLDVYNTLIAFIDWVLDENRVIKGKHGE